MNSKEEKRLKEKRLRVLAQRLLQAGTVTKMKAESSGAVTTATIEIKALHRDLLQYPINGDYDDMPATNPFLPPKPLPELIIEQLKKKLP